ncbi:hypothetical protein POM88_011848 [Heracleum sosnowskyi]|uniref:Uncharacterized protein n=1 Tax=Heracleum sosnowskyi TaxID=360622 RepID=A0AAD8N1Y5_9APIA|nr:hypothetical protein POM88_011848 [Heracleum sosnowskyi]
MMILNHLHRHPQRHLVMSRSRRNAKRKALSPYAAYEDLKTPCSPCPTPSGPKETPFTVSALAEASEVTKVESASVVENDPLLVTNYCHSPYSVLRSSLAGFLAYEDFKPPTSPSPSSPTITQSSTSFVTGGSPNGTPQPPSSAPQSRPLSPFPMYEDLKPPTSPIPPKAK